MWEEYLRYPCENRRVLQRLERAGVVARRLILGGEGSVPLLTNAQQNMGFFFSAMIRTGVLYHGTLRDSWVIYEGQYHNQMVCVI